jgi:hypothetical protein
MNLGPLIALAKLIVDSGAVSPKAPTRPSWLQNRDRSSGKGQGARVDLGLLRHFK